MIDGYFDDIDFDSEPDSKLEEMNDDEMDCEPDDDDSALWNHRETMDEYLEKISKETGFDLSQSAVIESVNEASAFFGIPAPQLIVDGWPICVNTQGTGVYEDDIVGYSRENLMDAGINENDAFDLVMTHEMVHRLIENNSIPGIVNGTWEAELASDFFPGVRAELSDISPDGMKSSLLSLQGSDSHPPGKLRADFMEYGRIVTRDMMIRGVQPTFQNTASELMDFFRYKQNEIMEMKQIYKS